MKIYPKVLIFITVVCLFYNCTKNEYTISKDIEIQDFVWKGMNALYFWQSNIPNLADTRFASQSQLNDFLNGYSSPEEIFEALRFQPGVVDRFSWIVDDYIALENSFQGINISTGMDFGLKRYKDNSTNLYGYVKYVIPNSSAASKDVKRGMIFNTINGTQITDSNYQSLLFGNASSLNIGFANFNNGNPISNDSSMILSKEEIAENPIAISKIIHEGNKKIGYLLYNQFSSSYDEQLNAAFNSFKNENINDLIIDVRYNGGGSTKTATYLGSMITGQFTGKLYSKEVWNHKIQKASSADRFFNYFTDEIKKTDQNGNIVLQESINSLHLSSVYFIVSGSTASASELVINSLRSYIDVKIVGTTTVGKQVGSVTLYDSDNLRKNGSNLNTTHTYAIQPIVLEISNKDNQNESDGFTPGITLPGLQIAEDAGNLGILGEGSDPILNKTIQYIVTDSKGISKNEKQIFSDFYNSKLAYPAGNNMYSDFK
jgi:C-terminal processing protease CtpA/Prc